MSNPKNPGKLPAPAFPPAALASMTPRQQEVAARENEAQAAAQRRLRADAPAAAQPSEPAPVATAPPPEMTTDAVKLSRIARIVQDYASGRGGHTSRGACLAVLEVLGIKSNGVGTIR